MENIFAQIETIFSGEAEEKPQWATEILQELKEIKQLLKEQKEEQKIYKPANRRSFYHTKNNREFYEFIKEFRTTMKPDVPNDIYPTFEYQGRRLGIDNSGLLYDKKDLKILPKAEAFKIYRYAYNQQKAAI